MHGRDEVSCQGHNSWTIKTLAIRSSRYPYRGDCIAELRAKLEHPNKMWFSEKSQSARALTPTITTHVMLMSRPGSRRKQVVRA